MGAQERVGYRPPLTSVLPVAAVMALFAIVLPFEEGWAIAIVVSTLAFVLRMRQLMVLGEDEVEVTVVRTRRIPWPQIESFEAGSGWRGGTVIHTVDGRAVRAVAPCSWWGGPGRPQDVDNLNRMLARRGHGH